MSLSSQCPRCDTPLVAVEMASTGMPHDSSMKCDSCAGTFVPAGSIDQTLLADARESDAADDSADSRVCPGCQQPMSELVLGDVAIDRCTVCSGIWLDGGEQLQPGASADPSSASSALSRYLLYSLSLPERTVRSTLGLAAGAARETAAFLVPQAFQSSKTYEIVVRNSLKFLTEDIGGAASRENEQQDDKTAGYVARKAVGNFVDMAGLATLHVSPLWLLAIVSDVAYGSKSFLGELAEELKRDGLIDDTSTIHHVDDVLGAIQQASGTAASAFDTPPLSVDQLRQTMDETRSAITSADYTSILPEAELKQYWDEMKQVAQKEDVSLLGVSGALTMHSLDKFTSAGRGALTTARVAGGLLNRQIIGHYADSLVAVKQRGFYETVRESSGPYVEAVWNNFSHDRETWTEEVVTGRAFQKALNGIKGWMADSAQDAEKSADSETSTG